MIHTTTTTGITSDTSVRCTNRTCWRVEDIRLTRIRLTERVFIRLDVITRSDTIRSHRTHGCCMDTITTHRWWRSRGWGGASCIIHIIITTIAVIISSRHSVTTIAVIDTIITIHSHDRVRTITTFCAGHLWRATHIREWSNRHCISRDHLPTIVVIIIITCSIDWCGSGYHTTITTILRSWALKPCN